MIKYIFFGVFGLAMIATPALVSPVPHQDPTDLQELSAHIEKDVFVLEQKVDSIISARRYQQDSFGFFILNIPIQLTKSIDNAANTNENISEESNDR